MRTSLFLFLVACQSSPKGDTTDAQGSDAEETGEVIDHAEVFDADPPTVLGPEDRPAEVVLPDNYDVSQHYPLVVMLHGYGANSALQDVVFGLKARARSMGFVLITPDGTVDRRGSQFWNATAECCNFYGSDVDDVAYLSGLIEEAHTLYPLSHTAVMGHSNGGFMSYRMACERPDIVDRIAPLAGTLSTDAAECPRAEPMPVLHMHGTADDTIAYDAARGHNGARESIAHFADLGGCEAPEVVEQRDHLGSVDGAETTVERWSCPSGDPELWTGEGGDHIYISVNDTYRDNLAQWLVAP